MANDTLDAKIVLHIDDNSLVKESKEASRKLNNALKLNPKTEELKKSQENLRTFRQDLIDTRKDIKKFSKVRLTSDELQKQIAFLEGSGTKKDGSKKTLGIIDKLEQKIERLKNAKALATDEKGSGSIEEYAAKIQRAEEKLASYNQQLAIYKELKDKADASKTKSVIGYDLNKVDTQLNQLAEKTVEATTATDSFRASHEAANAAIRANVQSEKELADTSDEMHEHLEKGDVNLKDQASTTEQLSNNLKDADKNAGELEEHLEKGDTNLADEVQKVTNNLDKAKATAKESIKLNLNANVSKMEYADLIQYIDKLKARLAEIRKNGIPEEQKEEFTKITNKLVEAEQAAKNYVKSLKDAKAIKLPPIDLKADVAKMNIAELVRYMQQLKAVQKEIESQGMPTSRSAEYQQVTDQLIRAQRATADYKRNLDQTATSSERTRRSTVSFSKVLEKLRSLGHTAVSRLKSGFNDLHKVVNKVRSTFSKFSSQMNRDMKHRFTNLVKYVLGFRSLFFLVRRLRKYIGEGLQNLARYDDKVSKGVKSHNLFNDAMNKLMTSLNYLKNAWAAAFSPIVIYVMPVLTSLIDKLAEVGNYVAYFIASLTGQATAYNALKSAVDDYADSLDKSGSSAKKNSDKQDDLNEKLAEYDKLLVIKQDKDKDNTNPTGGSGSNNKTAEDFNKMFKTITADDSLAKALKDALDNEDFTSFGKLIGEKIRDGLAGIDWVEIRKKIGEVGKKIGEFIKGLFSAEGLAEEIGYSAGQVINAISDFFDELLRQTKDIDFGKGLADVIKAFIKSTDWNLVKSNIREAIKQLKDNIKSLIDNFPWAETAYELGGLATTLSSAIATALSDEEFMKSVGKAIANSINVFIIVLKSALTGAKGKSVGGGLAASLNEIFDTIKWDTLGQTIGDGIAYIFNNVADFLDGVKWDKLGDAIYKFLSNIDWKSVISSIVRLIFTAGQTGIDLFTAIGDGVSEGIMSIKPEDLEESIKTLLEQLTPEKVASNLGKIATAIIKSLFATASIIHAVIEAFNNVVDDALTGIGQEIGEKLKKKGKPVTILTVIGELGEMIIFGLYDGILAAIAGVGKWIYDNLVLPIFNAICGKDAFDMHSPSKTAEKWGTWIIDGLFNGLKGFWNTIKSIFDPNNNDSIFGKIKGAFSTKNFENIKSALGTAWTTVTGIFTDTWKTISSAFDPNNTNSVIGKLKGIFSTKNLESVKNTLSTAWSTVTGIFTNTWKTIGDHFAASKKDSIWKKLQEKFNPTYIKDNLLNGANGLSKAWSAVTGVFTNTWEKIKGAFEGKDSFIEKIKKAFSSVFKFGATYSSKRKDSDLSFFERLFGYDVAAGAGKKHIKGVLDNLYDTFIGTFNDIKKGLVSPINKILDLIEGVVNAVIGGINAIGKNFSSFKIGDKKIFPGTFNPISEFKFDRKAMGLANGAVIPPNKEFLAILGDQKQGTNIETPLNTMVDAFKIALAENGSTNHDPIVLQLNSRVVAQAVWDEETKKYKQTGFGLAY